MLRANAAKKAPAQKPQVEVTFQASTDISDDGAQINGKLCFRDTHWDLTPVPNGAGTVDLLGVNRHFIVGRMSANENRVVGAISERVPPTWTTVGVAADQLPFRPGEQKGAQGIGAEVNEAVELRFGPDHLVGRIGWHQFSVRAVGDHLEGQYQFRAMNPVGLKLYGMDKLWELPIAEQGVLLPSLLKCLDKVATRDFVMGLGDLRRVL